MSLPTTAFSTLASVSEPTTAVYSMNKSRAGSCSRISPASIPDWRKRARGFTYGWFACVFMGLMWWLGFLAFLVLFFYEAAEDTISELLRFAVVGGAIAVPVIGFLTALVGSAIQVFIRWRRRKPLPQAA